MLHLVDTDPAREADLQALKNALERRLNEPGLFDPRPVRCWGMNLSTFCPCAKHTGRRKRPSEIVRPKQPWELSLDERDATRRINNELAA